MIWLQGAVSFLVWIGYGVLQSRRSGTIREQVGRIPRARRGFVGALLFVVGAMVLIGGLGIVLQQGGFGPNGMSPVAWIATTLLGLGFVHAQTMGTALLVSLVQENVTNRGGKPSFNSGEQTDS